MNVIFFDLCVQFRFQNYRNCKYYRNIKFNFYKLVHFLFSSDDNVPCVSLYIYTHNLCLSCLARFLLFQEEGNERITFFLYHAIFFPFYSRTESKLARIIKQKSREMEQNIDKIVKVSRLGTIILSVEPHHRTAHIPSYY